MLKASWTDEACFGSIEAFGRFLLTFQQNKQDARRTFELPIEVFMTIFKRIKCVKEKLLYLFTERKSKELWKAQTFPVPESRTSKTLVKK